MKYTKIVVRLFVPASAKTTGFGSVPFIKAGSSFLGSDPSLSNKLQVVVVDLNKQELIKNLGGKVGELTVDFVLATPNMSEVEHKTLKAAFGDVPPYVKSRTMLVVSSFTPMGIEVTMNNYVTALLNAAAT